MNQTVYTIIGFTVIFVLNALGSAFVFFFKKDASPKANTLFLGFAAGVMVAASFFFLLLPAFEGAGSWGVWSFIPVAVGFCSAGYFSCCSIKSCLIYISEQMKRRDCIPH